MRGRNSPFDCTKIHSAILARTTTVMLSGDGSKLEIPEKTHSQTRSLSCKALHIIKNKKSQIMTRMQMQKELRFFFFKQPHY